MTELDDIMVPLAQDLLDEFGKDVVFENVTQSYDPATGQTTDGTPTNVTVKVTPPEPFETRYKANEIFEEGDMITFIAKKGLTFTPDNGQLMTFDAQLFRIVRVLPIYSGELIALFGLQLRR